MRYVDPNDPEVSDRAAAEIIAAAVVFILLALVFLGITPGT